MTASCLGTSPGEVLALFLLHRDDDVFQLAFVADDHGFFRDRVGVLGSTGRDG